MRIPSTLLAVVLATGATAAPKPVDISSGPAQVALLELYTSEGCSSCPPGEKWLSGLVHSDHLWRDFVPVAFHVDYWDRLGWTDPLGDSAHSNRQRRYAAEWHANSIYTPGFVLEGRECRSGRPNLGEIEPAKSAGTLRAIGTLPGELNVEFSNAGGGPWIANAAILGNGIGIDVLRGENAGRHLAHDFAVLEWRTVAVAEGGHASFDFASLPPDRGAQRLAVAVWIERPGSPAPVQAAGGWLDLPVAQVP